MSSTLKDKWDRIYQTSNEPSPVVDVLKEHTFLLPKSGLALDLACGRGINSLYMANLGLQVEAWDISAVALAELNQQAEKQGLQVITRCCNIVPDSLPANQYDVILVSRFLDRHLSNAIVQALRPSGLLFYQTFTQKKVTPAGPRNPDYLLAENELFKLFSGLAVIMYREFGATGDIKLGLRNEAQLVAYKK